MTQVKKTSAIILISLFSLIIPQGLHAQTPIQESTPPAKEAPLPKVETSNETPNPPEKGASEAGFWPFVEKYLSPLATLLTFGVISWQSWLLYQTAKLQANTTQLSQVKLQLETILRGSAVPLGQQALSVGYSDNQDMIQKRKDFIITQICGEDASDEKKAWVTTLVNQWFELEKKLSA